MSAKKDLVSGLAAGVIRGVIASRTGQPTETAEGEVTTPRRSLWQNPLVRRFVIVIVAAITFPLWGSMLIGAVQVPGLVVVAIVAICFLITRRQRQIDLPGWLAEQVNISKSHSRATLIGAGVGQVAGIAYLVAIEPGSPIAWISGGLSLINLTALGAWIGALLGRLRDKKYAS